MLADACPFAEVSNGRTNASWPLVDRPGSSEDTIVTASIATISKGSLVHLVLLAYPAGPQNITYNAVPAIIDKTCTSHDLQADHGCPVPVPEADLELAVQTHASASDTIYICHLHFSLCMSIDVQHMPAMHSHS